MNALEWQRMKGVLTGALALPASDRAAFLAGACEDEEMRRRAESLLVNVDSAGAFLEAPALEAAAAILEESRKHAPALTPGRRLGRYEILSPLGAGGMGEVYRARDSKLKRDVAVKVLPGYVSGDPEFLARFEREASAVAALSHPNILSIFDFGNEDGIAFAVMELLEGSTLREMLAAGPISQRKAADYAQQVAKGLWAAHERGVVHRDLKPENLFVTKDGQVKILDFGLAKNIGKAAPGKQTSAPTVSGHTQPGTVMGTVGYMSPEQVRGLTVDHRSDIFCLGAVLYEMLSGRRAFSGATAADTMSAILNAEPPELSGSGRRIPPGLDRIARHCLEKNAEERFQNARDLAFALESVSPTSGEQGVVAAPRRKLRSAALVAAATLVLLAAVGGWLLLRRAPMAPEVSFNRLTFRRGNMVSARFTPDGQSVVFAAAWEGAPAEVFTVRTDGTESRPLGLSKTGVESISSKGEVAILIKLGATGSGTLARVPLNGGTPREVLEDVVSASWAPNGEDLAVVHGSPTGQLQLEYPVGKTLAEAPFLLEVKVSPGGDLVAVAESDYGPQFSIQVFDSKGGKRTPVSGISEIGGLAWSPRGDEILYVGGPRPQQQALRAVSLDGRGRVLWPGKYFLHDVSPTGRILLEKWSSRTGLVCLPRGESREREVSWLGGSIVTDISSDGQLVLFTEAGDRSGPKIGAFLRRSDGTPAVRLGDGWPLSLSEDGRSVLAFQTGPDRLVLLPTGAGSPKLIPIAGVEPAGGMLLPGAKGFLVWARPKGRPVEYFTVPPEGGKPRPIPAPDAESGFGAERRCVISPDGDRLLYGAEGRSLRIVPLAGGEAQKVPGAPLERGEYLIQWAADGRTVYVGNGRSLPAAVDKLDLTTGHRQPWKQFMPADPAGVTASGMIVVSRDGGSYAYSYQRVTSSDLYVVDGLQAKLRP